MFLRDDFICNLLLYSYYRLHVLFIVKMEIFEHHLLAGTAGRRGKENGHRKIPVFFAVVKSSSHPNANQNFMLMSFRISS